MMFQMFEVADMPMSGMGLLECISNFGQIPFLTRTFWIRPESLLHSTLEWQLLLNTLYVTICVRCIKFVWMKNSPVSRLCSFLFVTNENTLLLEINHILVYLLIIHIYRKSKFRISDVC